MKIKHNFIRQALTCAVVLTFSCSVYAADGTNADNSANNKRDSAGNTLTPANQSNSKGDIKITQDIRKDLMKDENLSTNAKNTKIITVNGKVTLRGPVNSESEKATVCKFACKVAGEANVDNQLEVKTK